VDNLTIAALVVDVIPILSQFGTSTVDKIKQNLASSGTNATGKTSNSIKFSVKDEGLRQMLTITGRPFFMTVETGRKATPDYKPSQQFVETIRQWMQAKGVPGSAYAIAQAIHKKGTKLHQTGGRSDIVSSVVNEGLVQEIAKSVLAKFSSDVLKNSVKLFNSGTVIN